MKSALLIIDVQHDLFEGSRRPFEADAVIERINALTAKARAAGAPVVFVQHEEADSPLEYNSPGCARRPATPSSVPSCESC
ncbi:isochorismatase family protein [Collimonas pratensis]|uniref:isochorismatase family protein n=1 Tax=Collimonas pratensis TaxID=279113 RepID=UPI002FFBA85B